MGREANGAAHSLRDHNRRRVIDTLRELGVDSRAEIARRTGLSRSTVSTLVTALADEGLVVDRPGGATGRAPSAGRPPALIALGRPAGIAVGVDFGKRHLAVAAADLSHTVLAESRRAMPGEYDAATGIAAAASAIDAVLSEAGVEREEVLGVGMGLPGPIHLERGRVGPSTILPGWVGVSVEEDLAAGLGFPIHIDNDANLGALAELHWGAAKGSTCIVYLKVATGIGAGLVVDGELFRGVGGTAGEIGHLTVDEEGPICRCGSRGCLETFAAAPAIVGLLSSSLGEDGLTIEDVVRRAEEGDAGCRRAIGDAGRHIGGAVANVCNLLNPEQVVVGGTVGQCGDVLLDEMREAVRRRAIATAAQDVRIVEGTLGERAEVLGAVALVLGDASPPAHRRAWQGLAERQETTQEVMAG